MREKRTAYRSVPKYDSERKKVLIIIIFFPLKLMGFLVGPLKRQKIALKKRVSLHGSTHHCLLVSKRSVEFVFLSCCKIY